ncbi:RHS repeat-associated core domain-containing protein [Pseudobacteriovorax antillogorgiicola]|uniref:RHS repeat-associated core domain-containing protein n=1 Tax=Pseudobacteriovorax antillogorgiicola TaxID=1513793 RepID=A0A1Y6BXV0_9BACT|nr:RHS repeat-associated core domain-containing protein [Pseudobacteriovorax antillogorgiicola]TCS53029.1 RHS repeat-associated protein [Pseudobacteriovorax antillogorgiicola]SMF26795.1 RHS repeat-associated core domain-containing protein [Pseudobacteriovorax antillogorgiicola]
MQSFASASEVHTLSPEFSSGVVDHETGLVYMNARYYNPTSGAFTSPDPLFIAAPDICEERYKECNLYSYVANDPVNSMDPTGLARQSVRRRSVRSLTAEQTRSSLSQAGVRGTLTSRMAGGFRLFRQTAMSTLARRFGVGSYAHQRIIGSSIINRGRSGAPIRVEVDHTPTVGAQLPGGSSMRRRMHLRVASAPSMALPRQVHRLHPTTSGGSNYDRGVMAGQERRHIRAGNYYQAMRLHFQGYQNTRVNWPRYGTNVHQGMAQNAVNAVRRARRLGLISSAEERTLIGLANQTSR